MLLQTPRRTMYGRELKESIKCFRTNFSLSAKEFNGLYRGYANLRLPVDVDILTLTGINSKIWEVH